MPLLARTLWLVARAAALCAKLVRGDRLEDRKRSSECSGKPLSAIPFRLHYNAAARPDWRSRCMLNIQTAASRTRPKLCRRHRQAKDKKCEKRNMDDAAIRRSLNGD